MSEEFSTGVKILLQRMETHPEEFFVVDELERDRPLRPSSKWHNVMISMMQIKFKESARGDALFFTDAEVDALYAGYSKIRRKAFDDYVMDSVLNPVAELSSSEDMISKMQGQFGQQKIRLQGANNNINQMQAHAQHIAAHQQAVGLMNAYPYASSQDPHPQDNPQTQSMLSKMAKGLGFK